MRAAAPAAPLNTPALAEVESALLAQAARAGAQVDEDVLPYRCGRYRWLRIASPALSRRRRVLLIRAGIHGDERAGPLMLAQHLADLFVRARALAIGLVVYPLDNPSGYQHGLRYNADHDRGAEGNNDCLRYRLDDDSASGAPGRGDPPFAGWHWSDDPALGLPLPLETRVMLRHLRAEPLDRLAAVLDLHQDHLTPALGPAAYHYAFGDLHRYDGIVARVREQVPLLARTRIGAGFGTCIDPQGHITAPPVLADAPTSDEHGFIVRHDGTLTDLAWRLGAQHAVAPETSGATPLHAAIAVNLAWAEGLLELLAAPAAREASGETRGRGIIG